MPPLKEPTEVIGPVELPLSADGVVEGFRLWLYRFDRQRYLVLTRGGPEESERPLVRISSMCNFGHVWGSEYCDCRWQLEESKRLIGGEGTGAIIFAFDHHGKGVGLENHYRVYSEGQKRGLELVVDAYEALGFPEDARDYGEIAIILHCLRMSRIRLLTNSPKRIEALEQAGIQVQRVPLEMPRTAYNSVELAVKRRKLGHLLSAEWDA